MRTFIRPMLLLAFSLLVIQPWQSSTQASVDVPFLENVGSVSAGVYHTCVISTAGPVKCWGENEDGQLGVHLDTTRVPPGCPGQSPEPIRCSRFPVSAMGLRSSITQISAGHDHTCALTSSGGVKCWGENEDGQLGNGTTVTSPAPVEVCATGATPPCSSAAGNVLTGAIAVGTGHWHSCALVQTGAATRAVKCWGQNDLTRGQLGDGLSCATPCTRPVDVTGLSGGQGDPQVTGLGVGAAHACVLTAGQPGQGGGVKCWGWNDYGQLGNGTSVASSVPVDVVGLGANVAGIAIGSEHSCAIMLARTVKCWGRNPFGELGDGQACGLECHVPTDVCQDQACTLPLSGVESVAAGGYHTCAVIAATGGVRCWGNNEYGQLAAATTQICSTNDCSTTPLDATGLQSGVTAITAGGYSTCALIETTGAVKCWGDNRWGQIGDGTITQRNTPVEVVSYDDDEDGCTDTQELGADETKGGRRNPKSFWDFFDMWTESPPIRDEIISNGDQGAVIGRFGSTDDNNHDGVPDKPINRYTDPLTLPPATGYHPAFDRGGVAPGGDPWDLLPADGNVSVGDIGALVAQFGHNCQ